MADEPFLAEIRLMSFNFPPKGWALCNGQLLPINQNQALFSLLGTTYGGDGRVNFALPDLRGRVPIHMGDGHTLGERAGEENNTLIMSEMAAHTHFVRGDATTPAIATLSRRRRARCVRSVEYGVPRARTSLQCLQHQRAQ